MFEKGAKLDPHRVGVNERRNIELAGARVRRRNAVRVDTDTELERGYEFGEAAVRHLREAGDQIQDATLRGFVESPQRSKERGGDGASLRGGHVR